MFGPRVTMSKGARDEAEKPFWISYADLMTALMVLFLIVMVVALIDVRQQAAKLESQQALVASQQALIATGQRATKEAIQQQQLEARKTQFEKELARALPPGANLNFESHRIDLGAIAKFGNAESSLAAPEELKLRRVAAAILTVYEASGRGLLTRVDIEGFASKRGKFLGNLSLSLERAERMMCAMLTGAEPAPARLSLVQQQKAARLFAIGGRSSNDLRKNEAESRRIELALQYVNRLGEAESTGTTSGSRGPFATSEELGACPLGP